MPVAAGDLDVRFDLAGYGSQYLWRQEIFAEEAKQVGEVRLKKGASVAGWVVSADENEAPDATIELRPRLAAVDAYRRDERSLALHEAGSAVDHRGAFVLTGIAPGEYVLTANAEGYCETETRVAVAPGESLVSLEPVILSACAQLEIFVEPVVDFGGESWTLELSESRRGDGKTEVVRTLAFGPDGSTMANELKHRTYSLEIQDCSRRCLVVRRHRSVWRHVADLDHHRCREGSRNDPAGRGAGCREPGFRNSQPPALDHDGSQ